MVGNLECDSWTSIYYKLDILNVEQNKEECIFFKVNSTIYENNA